METELNDWKAKTKKKGSGQLRGYFMVYGNGS